MPIDPKDNAAGKPAEGAADSNAGKQPDPNAGKDTGKGDDTVQISKAELEKIRDSLKTANAEAKKFREEREAEAKKVQEAEAKKAEAEGNFKKLFEDERKKADELTGKASKAEKLEAVVKGEVEELEKQLGDAAKSVAHLSPEDRLPILKQFARLSAAPGNAKNPALGGPAAVQPPAKDLAELSPEDRRKALDAMTPDQKRAELDRRMGASAPPTPFARKPAPRK